MTSPPTPAASPTGYAAFPHDWPADRHPLGFVFLHPDLNGARVSFEGEDIDALARHVFDDLGAVLPTDPPRRHDLRITVRPDQVGQPMRIDVEGPAERPGRVIRGALPPGLDVVPGAVEGVPTQSGVWLVTVRTGPQVHYQPPAEGPIGTYNPGTWIDIDKPLRHIDIDDLDDEQLDELERRVSDLNRKIAAHRGRQKEKP